MGLTWSQTDMVESRSQYTNCEHVYSNDQWFMYPTEQVPDNDICRVVDLRLEDSSFHSNRSGPYLLPSNWASSKG